jgi:hypothetical protein
MFRVWAKLLYQSDRLGRQSPGVVNVCSDQDIFWFKIGVNDFAFGVQIVQTLQHLKKICTVSL